MQYYNIRFIETRTTYISKVELNFHKETLDVNFMQGYYDHTDFS